MSALLGLHKGDRISWMGKHREHRFYGWIDSYQDGVLNVRTLGGAIIQVETHNEDGTCRITKECR